MANWKSFTIEVPGKDRLEDVREVLETLLVYLEILKTILETIKQFLVDFGNPIRVLVEALIKLIEELFLALKATGFFAYFDIPEPQVDPGFDRWKGGYQAFTERFKQSLNDTRDFNRPQPRAGSTKGGFVILLVDASDVFTLIRRIKQLLRFFGKEFTSPRYGAPVNFQAGPVGSSGDPIIDVAGVFAAQPLESILLTWSLPSSTETPDPGFSDAVTKVASEFIPPSFVIEKTVEINPAATKIDIETFFGNAPATGLVEFDRPTNIDSSLGGRFGKSDGVQVLRREQLRDNQGDPVIKFQQYIKLPTGLNVLGNLGTFRYIDNDVVAGTKYFYRVRAYSGSLAIDNDKQLIGPAARTDQLKTGLGGNSETPYFVYPSTDKDDEVIMGVPSGIIETTVPTAIDFDVLPNLKNILLTALTLDFHPPLPPSLSGIPNGPPIQFDSNGIPVPPAPNFYIGRGSLSAAAGILAPLTGDAALGFLAEFASPQSALEAANKTQRLPYQNDQFRFQATRLADSLASALLQAGDSAVLGFRDLMRQNLPRGPITDVIGLTGLSNMEAVAAEFTEVTETETGVVGPPGSTIATGGEITVDATAIQQFGEGYVSNQLRLNTLAIIQYLKNFGLGGIPPDWIAVVPLRDIIPWSGQMLYDLLDKIDALLAAFQGFIEEIKRFIDLLIRKIDALERFINLLLEILNFIEDLSVSAFILSVPEVSGGIGNWFAEIDNAGGDIPPSGAGGYSCGIGMAYVAIDITAFKTAFGIIFGT